jgi:hypothetical protein
VLPTGDSARDCGNLLILCSHNCNCVNMIRKECKVCLAVTVQMSSARSLNFGQLNSASIQRSLW